MNTIAIIEPLSIMLLLTLMSVNNEDIPNTNITFNIFEPTILPIKRLYFFLFIEDNPVNSSGKDVPSATIENPIFSSLTPHNFEIFNAFSTTKLVPKDNPITETTIIKIQ